MNIFDIKLKKRKLAMIVSTTLMSYGVMAAPSVTVDGYKEGASYTKQGSYTSANGNILVKTGASYTQNGGMTVGHNTKSGVTPSVSTVVVEGNNSTMTVNGNYTMGDSAKGASSYNIFLDNTGAVSTINGTMSIGHGEDDHATAVVDGKGSALNVSDNGSGIIYVGDQGSGELDIQNGSKLTADNMIIGNDSDANGLVNLSNTQNNLTNLLIGNEGSGTLALSDNASLNVDFGNGKVLIASHDGSTGMLLIGNGSTAGYLGAAEVDFGFGKGTVDFNFTDPEWDYGGRIKGDGTLIKDGAGKLVLNGDNSYFSGTTQVNHGSLFLTDSNGAAGKLGGDVSIGTDGLFEASADSILGNVKDDGHLVFSQEVTGSYANIISGSGVLVKQGKGTLALVGDDSAFKGTTQVKDGILQVGDQQGNGVLGGDFSVDKDATLQVNTNSVSGNIHTDGTTLFQQNDAGTYSQNITGDGEIDKTGNGVLTLTGNGSNFTGITQVKNGGIKIEDDGTLGGDIAVSKDATFETNANSISGNITNEGQITFNQPDDATYSHAISGSGGAFKDGQGKLTLTGDNSAFTGIMAISKGTLALSSENGHGDVGGTINALQGSVLQGDGTVDGDVNIYQGAIHHPGSQYQNAQTIKGNYTNYGSLSLTGNPDSARQVVVYGDVDVSGATLDLNFSPDSKDEWKSISGPLTLIDNEGSNGIKGQFSSINNNLLFLSPLLNYEGGNGNDLTITYTRNDKDFSSFAITKNEKNIAHAINTMQGNSPVWQNIALSNDINTLRNDLNQLSGEIHPAIQSALFDNTHYIRDAITGRLLDLHSHATSEFNYGSQVSDQDRENSAVVWSRGYGSWGSHDGEESLGTAKQKSNTHGMFLGVDIPKSYGRLGLLLGYDTSTIGQQSVNSSADIGTYSLGIYGGSEWKKLSLRSGVSAGWSSIKTKRDVNVGNFSDSLAGNYHAGTGQAFSEIGINLNSHSVNFEPFANVSYNYEQIDAFKESGDTAALKARGETKGAVLSTLGLRADRDFTLAKLKTHVYGSTGWQHLYNNADSISALSFADGSANYDVNGTSLSPNAFKVETGVDMNVNSTVSTSLSYTGTIAKKSVDNGVMGTVNVSF